MSPSPLQFAHPSVVTTKPRSRPARLEGTIPPLLRPFFRAYLLGYGFTVGPRVLSLLVNHLLRLAPRRHKGADVQDASNHPRPQFTLLEALVKTLSAGASLNRFPTFCAALVGGSTLLEPVLRQAFSRILNDVSDTTRTRLSRWFSSAIAAWFSIQLLQTPFTTPAGTQGSSSLDPHSPAGETTPPSITTTKPQAGRTLDLTLFAATRALDVMIGELWSRRPTHPPGSTASTLDQLASNFTDPFIFALTSGIAMWHWFYHPASLPPAYSKWIASAAAVDPRLIVALQRCRSGVIHYGRDTGQAPLLQAMCRDYGWPESWGDPAASVPFPCELVHMGCGPSCERHALSRLARAWLWSIRTYLPLQLLMFVARARASRSAGTLRRDLRRAVLSASRSSAFLGAFIALFYYGVCLARTRIGPRLLGARSGAGTGTGKEEAARHRQRLDGGLCIGVGCLLCGWSVLLESAGRRKELALFVAPRAVATVLPRRYDADKQWAERVAFAASTAVVFTCVLENKQRVRGVLGRLLRMVLAA